MSQVFGVADVVLWNPSNGVARLFVGQLDAVAAIVDLPTGLVAQVADGYELDVPVFTGLIDALVRRYCRSTRPVVRSLIESVAAIGVVLVQRAGGTVTALDQAGDGTDTSDVSVSTTGVGVTGDPEPLRQLASDLDYAMPC